MTKNRLKRTLHYTLVCCLFISIFACKPSIPSEYLQPEEMESLLYDYHKAEGIAESEAKTSEQKQVLTESYRAAVLRKHEVTQQEFDHSLAYYYRHTALIKEIYENLSLRFEQELRAQGAAISTRNMQFSEKGDTANVWKNTTALVLTPFAPYNKISFNIKADTNYKEGDRIILCFNSSSISQQGSINAVAILSIKFNNDSVKTVQQTIYSDTEYKLEVQDLSRVGIKEIRGLIYNNRDFSISSQPLNLLNIHDIYMLRIHTSQQQQNTEDTDSANVVEINPRLNPEKQRPLGF